MLETQEHDIHAPENTVLQTQLGGRATFKVLWELVIVSGDLSPLVDLYLLETYIILLRLE